MPDAAIIGVSLVDTALITTNLVSSKLTLDGVEAVLNGATGDTHKGGDPSIHAKGNWSVVAASKLTVGGLKVAITGNLATCGDAVIATSKLSTI